MPSKKLITLLHSLSRQELNRLEKYLESPFFNENENLVQIFKLVTKQSYKTNFLDVNTEKKILWKQLYNNQVYNDAQMRRLLSELTQHILRFFAFQKIEKNPIQEVIFALDTLKDTNLDLHFSGVLRQATALQEKSNLHGLDYYLNEFQIQNIQHYHTEKLGHKIERLENLEKADYYLNCFYVIQKLKYYCDVLEYKHSFSIDTSVDLYSGFFYWINRDTYLKQPLIHFYFLIANMLMNPDDESFYRKIRLLLYEKTFLINLHELKAIYIHLINYCVDKKINVGQVGFFKDLFELFKDSLKEELWLENQIMNSHYYKTIITVGIQVREFAWTEAFIQEYTPKLPPDERDNALTYNLAKVYFAQNQYEKVIEQLREVEYDNLTYALGGKLMLLKTYYELNEYLALDSLLDSFRVYLRRNKVISKEVRQQYLNVLRFIKKLSNVRPGDQAAIAKIEQQIEACKSLADKGWIVSKVQELKGLG